MLVVLVLACIGIMRSQNDLHDEHNTATSTQPAVVMQASSSQDVARINVPQADVRWTKSETLTSTLSAVNRLPNAVLPQPSLELGALPRPSLQSLEPLTSSPRRAFELLLRDTGFATH